MHIKNRSNLKKDEQGVVAIILTVFVLIVLSLVVVAFSQNSRREQRQSLDRQLSTQAFYAAESGVNQLISKIRANDPAIKDIKEYTSCDQNGASILDGGSGGQNAFSVTCLLFNRQPQELKWSNIDTTQGEFTSLHTVAGDLNKLTFKWTRAEGGGQYSDCVDAGSVTNIPVNADAYGTNCGAGILRVTLMPYAPTGASREKLYEDSFTVYLRPTSNGVAAAAQVPYSAHGPGATGAAGQGRIVPAACSGTQCEASILGVPSGGTIFAHIRSIYHANAVDLTGFNVSGQPVNYDQAQVKVDSTGKASDVLRRIQVRMPLYDKYTMPATVLDAMEGICKRLGVYPVVGSTPARSDNSECGGLN